MSARRHHCRFSTLGQPQPGPRSIPLSGAVHAAYNGPTGTITVSNTDLATPHLTVRLNGGTGKQSSLDIQAQCDDLDDSIRSCSSQGAPPPVVGNGLSGAGGAARDRGIRFSSPASCVER